MDPHANASQQAVLCEQLGQKVREAGHFEFFRELRDLYACGDFLFVHAGLRPGASIERQSRCDLLNIRGEFLRSRRHFGKVVVHGHTPVSRPDVRVNRINIDTGAYISGQLTCLAIEGEAIEFI